MILESLFVFVYMYCKNARDVYFLSCRIVPPSRVRIFIAKCEAFFYVCIFFLLCVCPVISFVSLKREFKSKIKMALPPQNTFRIGALSPTQIENLDGKHYLRPVNHFKRQMHTNMGVDCLISDLLSEVQVLVPGVQNIGVVDTTSQPRNGMWPITFLNPTQSLAAFSVKKGVTLVVVDRE